MAGRDPGADAVRVVRPAVVGADEQPSSTQPSDSAVPRWTHRSLNARTSPSRRTRHSGSSRSRAATGRSPSSSAHMTGCQNRRSARYSAASPARSRTLSAIAPPRTSHLVPAILRPRWRRSPDARTVVAWTKGGGMNLNGILIGSDNARAPGRVLHEAAGQARLGRVRLRGLADRHGRDHGRAAQRGPRQERATRPDHREHRERRRQGRLRASQGGRCDGRPEPYNFEQAPGTWIATFSDPDGNYFQLISPMTTEPTSQA